MTERQPRVPPALALGVAVLAMSWSAPLVRFTDAPALVVAAWRLVASVAFVGVVLTARGAWPDLLRLDRPTLVLLSAAGVLLALHFWSWIASLDYTTVASSVVLVSMQPFFVALLSAVLLAERPVRREWLGIALAVAGAAAIGWGDLALGRRALFGDALALAGALFVSGYYIIGRGVRPRLDLWVYVFVVYGVAAAALVVAALAMPGVALTGYAARDWAVFVALAAGPMMVGHTGINYALRYVPAYVANLAILGEPVGATLLAWLLPAIREVPGPQVAVGAVLVLTGIAIGGSAGASVQRHGPSRPRDDASVHGRRRRHAVD